MILRVAVANVAPEDFARDLLDEGLSGTVIPAVGFTPDWGAEPTALAIIAGISVEELHGALLYILAKRRELWAYVDDGTDAWLFSHLGDVDRLSAA